MTLSVQVRHSFPDFQLDAEFQASGGVTALFGRSGSGKSTIINAVAGLLRPDEATISLAGDVLVDTATRQWLAPHRRQLGYVFQEGRLFPHMTVQQNLNFGQRFAGRRRSAADASDVIEMLGIGDLLARRTIDLSGGEKQRVAIGRALLSAPRMLLLDEPLAALDQQRKMEILPFLENLRQQSRVPILYVSHSVAEIARLADQIVLVDGGRVAQTGAVQQVFSDPGVAPMLGLRETGAILPARVHCHHDDGLTELRLDGGASLFLPRIEFAPGVMVHVRILAQDVMVSLSAPTDLSALNILAVTIADIRRGDGPGAIIQLQLAPPGEGEAPGTFMLARLTRRSVDALGLKPGLTCYAVIKSVAVAQQDIW